MAEQPDYAALVERLRRPHTAAGCGCLCCTAADAIEVLLSLHAEAAQSEEAAFRAGWRARFASRPFVLSGRMTEDDALAEFRRQRKRPAAVEEGNDA